MDDAEQDDQALFEAVVFLNHFNDLRDLRQRGKVTYPLDEVLLLALFAVLAGAESFVEIARFSEKKLDLWLRFRPFRDGTSSHDHLGDIFAAFDAGQFQCCFVAGVAALTGMPVGVVAIDGKTVYRSGGKAGKCAIHMVSLSPPVSALYSGR
jgi:DDE_Tnp_1-associated